LDEEPDNDDDVSSTGVGTRLVGMTGVTAALMDLTAAVTTVDAAGVTVVTDATRETDWAVVETVGTDVTGVSRTALMDDATETVGCA